MILPKNWYQKYSFPGPKSEMVPSSGRTSLTIIGKNHQLNTKKQLEILLINQLATTSYATDKQEGYINQLHDFTS